MATDIKMSPLSISMAQAQTCLVFLKESNSFMFKVQLDSVMIDLLEFFRHSAAMIVVTEH
jgi:hypothetical protein